MYFETWKYMFFRRSLAHINYKCFSVGIFGGLAPSPHTKKLATLLPIPTEVITCFACLLVSLYRRKIRTLFRWGFFFLAGGGVGLSTKSFSAPYENPSPPPPVPPYWKNSSYATAFKGSRSHLQISLNIMELCKDKKHTNMMMYMKSYSCRL